MTAQMRNVGFRLAMDGKAETINDFADVQRAGEVSMDGFAAAAEKAADRAVAAADRYTERQLASFRKQATAAKLAAAGAAANAGFDEAAGRAGNGSQFATVSLDRTTPAAYGRRKADIEAAFAEEDASARKAAEAERLLAQAETDRAAAVAKLRAAIDPLAVVEAKHAQAVAEADRLLAAGAISTKEHASATQLYAARLEQGRQALDSTGAAQEQLTARTRAFLGALDPAYAAQQRFDREMGEARTLIGAGTITLDQYCDKLRQERQLLDQSSDAHRRGAATTGAHRAAMQGLSFQVQDTFTQISMGANPLSVLAIQGGQAAGQFANLEGKAGKFASFMIGPWGLAITGGLLVLGALTDGLLDNDKASEKAEAGLKKFQDRQSDIGNFIDSTTGKLKEQNRTLVLNAILSRQAQIAENEKEVAKGRNAAFDAARAARLKGRSAEDEYATQRGGGLATGGIDPDVQRAVREAKGNVDKLASSIAALAATKRPDLKDLAVSISSQAGAAIIATRENAELRKELKALNGDTTALAKADTALIEARAKLAGATSESDRAQARYTIAIKEADAAYNASNKTAADQKRLLEARTTAERALNVAQDASKKGEQGRAVSLARQASAMEVNASAALDLADAYLAGGDAAIKAEAARRGLTDATRRGIDGEAQTRRQLAIMVGDQVVAGAKAVSQLREEANGRKVILDQVTAGTTSVYDMNQALAEEAALRPLLKLQTLAQGTALAALNRVIVAYGTALKGAREQEAQFGLERAIGASVERVEELKASIVDVGLAPLDAAMNAAKRAAQVEADAQKFPEGDRRDTFIASRVAEAEQRYLADRARYVQDAVDGNRDAVELAEKELALAGVSADVRDRELRSLSLQQEIRRRFPDLGMEDVRTLLAGEAALDATNAKLKVTAAAIDEARSFGSSLVETVLSEDTWSSWGNAGKAVLGEIKAEFIKLALLNPLRNLINGNSNLPTLTSMIGNVGKLFGATPAAPVGKNAVGTEHWSGGLTWVGENGPELIDAPRGARITPAAESRRILASNDNAFRRPIEQHFHFEGAVMTQELVDQMNAIGAGAAIQGAAGGAAVARADGEAMAQRRIGRRW